MAQVNPITGKWELAPPNAQPKLNPYTNKYEMAPQNAVPRFNPRTRQYEMAPPDARLELNTQTGTWRYVRRAWAPPKAIAKGVAGHCFAFL